MITPTEWDVLLEKNEPRSRQKAWVAKYAAEVLDALPEGKLMSTNDLVEALYSREAVKSQASEGVRLRIYSIVAELTRTELKPYATKGPPDPTKKFMGRPVRPWLWHKPRELETCAMCGQLIGDHQ